jgi:hypothetical protein
MFFSFILIMFCICICERGLWLKLVAYPLTGLPPKFKFFSGKIFLILAPPHQKNNWYSIGNYCKNWKFCFVYSFQIAFLPYCKKFSAVVAEKFLFLAWCMYYLNLFLQCAYVAILLVNVVIEVLDDNETPSCWNQKQTVKHSEHSECQIASAWI